MAPTRRKFGGKKKKSTIKYTWGIHSLTRKRMKTHRKKKRSHKRNKSRRRRKSRGRRRKGGDDGPKRKKQRFGPAPAELGQKRGQKRGHEQVHEQEEQRRQVREVVMDAPPVAGLGSPGVPAVMSPAVPNVSGGGGGGAGAGDDEVREQEHTVAGDGGDAMEDD